MVNTGIIIIICAWCKYDEPKYREQKQSIKWSIQQLFEKLKVTHGMCIDCFNNYIRTNYEVV